MNKISPITVHLKKRAEQRFELKLNHQSRIELEKTAKGSTVIEKRYNPSDGNRTVRIVSLWNSPEVHKLNPDVKSTDKIICVCIESNKNHGLKILTVLPTYRADGILYESTYNCQKMKWD